MPAFSVAANGRSVQTANGPQQLLSMKNPLTKLDVTNRVSFQTIQLLFNHEPPQAPAVAPYYTNTLVYQFPHSYQYIPAVWMSWQNLSPAFPDNPPNNSANTIFYPNGDDNAGEIAYEAIVNNSIILGGNSLVALEQYNNAGSTAYCTQAALYVTADATNVNIYLIKETLETIGGSIIPLFMIGVILNLRIYVFAEPGTTSTY